MAENYATVAPLLDALSDPTRLQVVELLSEAPHRAGELAESLGVTPPAMSKHLRVLLRAGIVSDERLTEDARAGFSGCAASPSSPSNRGSTNCKPTGTSSWVRSRATSSKR